MMKSIKENILTFFNDEEGLTVVEYVVGAASMVIGFAAFFTDFANVLISKLADVLK